MCLSVSVRFRVVCLVAPPIETVGIYGAVFEKIAIAAVLSGVVLFALAPLLTR